MSDCGDCSEDSLPKKREKKTDMRMVGVPSSKSLCTTEFLSARLTSVSYVGQVPLKPRTKGELFTCESPVEFMCTIKT